MKRQFIFTESNHLKSTVVYSCSCSCVVFVLQSSPTCLHLCADLSTAHSTHGVRQVTQYADSSCHGRGWNVWINIVCQRQMKKKRISLRAEALVVLIAQTVTRCTHEWDARSGSTVAWQGNPGERGNVQTEPPCQQLVCQSDRCTSGSGWAWPGDNGGSRQSYKPHWLQQHTSWTQSWNHFKQVPILLDWCYTCRWFKWTHPPAIVQLQRNTSWLAHLIYVAWYQIVSHRTPQSVNITPGTNCVSRYTQSSNGPHHLC